MKPVISIVFPKNTRVECAVFNPTIPLLFSKASALFDMEGIDIEIGQTVLCETVKNNQWYGHRVDFILQRIENDWQPYIVEYDISKPAPLVPDLDKTKYLAKNLHTVRI
jgi:hypothetical protein